MYLYMMKSCLVYMIRKVRFNNKRILNYLHIFCGSSSLELSSHVDFDVAVLVFCDDNNYFICKQVRQYL